MSEGDRELVRRAVAGSPDAVRTLVEKVAPVIQTRVARALLRSDRARDRNARQEVEDLTQEVFASLFEDGGRALRAWNPSRGLSLANFVGFLAERQVLSILRSGRKSPWTEDPTLDEDLADLGPDVPGPDLRFASRELLVALLDRLRLELSPLGMQLFQLLYVEERSIEDVRAITGMQADAVYAWRSRLGKRVRRLAAELEAEAAQAVLPAESGRQASARNPSRGT